MPKKEKNNLKSAAPKKEKTPVEINFDGTEEIEPQAEKAKTVHGFLLPIFKKIFDVKHGKQIINGVKLKEEFGSMFTYVFNRPITEKEVNDIKAELEAAGARILDFSTQGMTVSKDYITLVLTFWLNNQQKSGAVITF